MSKTNSSIVTTSCVATSEENGIGVKIIFEGLDNLDEKLETAMDLVRAIFAQFKTHSSHQDTSGDVVCPKEMKPMKPKTRISSEEFNQACFSCLVEKKNAASGLNLCNPKFNKFLPVDGYEVSDNVADDKGNIVLIPYLFAAKVSHLQDDRRFTYCIDTKTFSLRECL